MPTETVARPDARPTGVTERNTATLKPVLDAIPDHCYERPLAKGLAAISLAVLGYAASLALLVVAHAWWLVVPLWVLAGLAVSGLFVLGHDAAHGALFDSKTLNRTVGRWLFLPSLHIYEAWVLGHNRIHHGHTLREGMDFVWHPLTVAQYLSLSWWQRARHRLEWSRLGAGFYYLREVWWNKMITFTPPERYRAAIRRDTRFVAVAATIAGVTVGAVGFVAGGPVGALWLVTKLLVVPFLVFCWFIGFTVYVHHISPDLAWWPRRRWTSFAGQVEGTTVLRTPRILNALFFHNIFVHVPHHVDVRIPFHALPEAADAIVTAFPEDVTVRKLSMRDYMATTRACKLYDFDEQHWLNYPDR